MENQTQITPIVGNEFAQIAMQAILSAQNSIKIIVFDWRWYPSDPASVCQQFNNELVKASRRGVQVAAVVNSQSIKDTLTSLGISVKKAKERPLLHTKIMIIDDAHVIIGSHNYSQNAFTMNFEFSVLIENCPQIERYLAYFNNIFN